MRDDDNDVIKGQIVISLLSRESARTSSSRMQNVVIMNDVENNSCNTNCQSVPPTISLSPSGENITSPINGSNNHSSTPCLPDGWEERQTSSGRIYYVNHRTRSTHWDKPPPLPERPRSMHESNNNQQNTSNNNSSDRNGSSPPPNTSSSSTSHITTTATTTTTTTATHSPSNQNQQQSSPNNLHNSSSSSSNRYQRRSTRHRHYLSRNQLHAAVADTTPPPPLPALTSPVSQTNNPTTSDDLPVSRTNNGSSTTTSTPASTTMRSNCSSSEGLTEGYEMKITAQGQVFFLHVQSGASTWYDPRVPRELINQDLNLDELVGQLPNGWEIRTAGNGRNYYVNHNSRTTQFTDPRLVANHQMLQSLLSNRNESSKHKNQSKSSIRSSAVAANNTPIEQESVTATRIASPTTKEVEKEKIISPSQSLLSSACNRRNLVQKMTTLRQELQAMQPQSGHCRLEVSREDIFEESYRAIMKMRPKDMRKRLMVKFRGEEGLDYGGIAREWLFLLSHEMLNPCYGLFQYTREDIYTLQINPDSAVNPVSITQTFNLILIQTMTLIQ